MTHYITQPVDLDGSLDLCDLRAEWRVDPLIRRLHLECVRIGRRDFTEAEMIQLLGDAEWTRLRDAAEKRYWQRHDIDGRDARADDYANQAMGA